MKNALLLSLAVVVSSSPIQAQAVDMTVSEFMEMEVGERNAFSGFVLGVMYGGDGDHPLLQSVRDCLDRWISESPTHWLSTLSEWMTDTASMANLGLVDKKSPQLRASQVLIEAIPSTCQGVS